MPLVATHEKNNFTIELHIDDSPANPREFEPLGTMACWHQNHNLGDEQPKMDPQDYLKATFFPDNDDEDVPMAALIEQATKESVILPLYLYDHSGLTMRTTPFNDRWDSGQVGFIYLKKDDIAKNWPNLPEGEARQKAIDALATEVAIYSQYLEGDVYGYKVLDSDGNELDSCWGFFGQEEALAAAECFVEQNDSYVSKVRETI